MFLRRRCGAPPSTLGLILAGVAFAGFTLTGCGGSPASSAATASSGASRSAQPVLQVVATNFAMAELVHGVGGNRVAVTDLAQGAPDDRTIVPDSAQTAALRSAQLVVEVGGGWQPQVETIAGSGPRVLALGHQVTTNGLTATGSQVWLDPVAMQAAANSLAAKLTALDPAGASAYRNGVRDFNDNLYSVGIDYQSSLSGCEYNVLFTPDSAFATVAARYGLRLHSLPAGSGNAAVNSAATLAATQSFHALFAEPPLPSPQITALAARGRSGIGQLDTMDGPPIRAEPAKSTYLDRLEANLTYLTGALYCQDSTGP